MARLDKPPLFRLGARDGARLDLVADDGAVAHVFVLEDDIIRVAVLPGGRFSMGRTWAIAPGAEDIEDAGRDRFDLTGFTQPAFQLSDSDGRLIVETKRLRLTLTLAGFFCRWAMRRGDEWVEIARDRPTQAYDFGWWGEGVAHYLARPAGERYFGLGECAGPMDRAGRRFALSPTDALGYDAGTSDPLYKSIPFYITLNSAGSAAFGLFYDTLSDCEFDFGCARDNYHGLFRGFAAPHGDLDYYVIAGPAVADVTRRFTWLTGRPAFLPRWSLGYSGSTMAYTDAPDAQARMAEFLDGCAANDILCSSFHLSSGYTSIGPRRHVFTWNRDKFPDPRAFTAGYAALGVHLCANIKPCLLADHPEFDAAWKAGLLVCEPDGQPSWVQWWDGLGAYLDFTNPGAAAWWKAHVTESLLSYGVDSTWNDNNEFEIRSPDALAKGFGQPFAAREARTLQTLLMMRASRQAQIAQNPAKRPFVVTRAGPAGLQRYAQTWSGDNSTSWETLKFNLKMGLGLSLSGVSNSGHDIGGFAGPAPDAELFVRWVQAGVFMPRFSIHSWNDDGTANEPWMHPQATPQVRALIRLRYRLMPYFYDLAWRYAQNFEPMTRPTFYDFPDDPRCLVENDELMVGAALLAAPVVEPGRTDRDIYLPAGCAWVDFWTGERFAGGQTVTRPAPLHRPPLLAREGGAIPLNMAEQHFGRPADERAFLVFPFAGEGEFAADCFEDDGEAALAPDSHGFWRLRVACTPDRIVCHGERLGARPPEGKLSILLHPSETRPLDVIGGEDG
ncbi:MAG TPA: glycoside hydrolase family 31 protein [Caulobacteraceae bacterium]|nr:glycoside hydrolase family 31 protein [Caulobacteraceae bacterium]